MLLSIAKVFRSVRALTSHMIIAKLSRTYASWSTPKADPTHSQKSHADADTEAATSVSRTGQKIARRTRRGRYRRIGDSSPLSFVMFGEVGGRAPSAETMRSNMALDKKVLDF